MQDSEEQLGHKFGCTLHIADDRQGFLLTETVGRWLAFLARMISGGRASSRPRTWR